MNGLTAPDRQLTRRKRILLSGLTFAILALAILASSEALLRAFEIRPWRKKDVAIRIDPGGTFFTKHPILGYTHIPGQFTVTLPDGYTFKVTHLPNTLRITHPLQSYSSSAQKKEIWLFGCSFTHGWALNDEETYAWLLQEAMPDYEVVNFGVGGYGTLQSLLQLRAALERKRPDVVVLAYASFHDIRNTFLRKRRKAVAPWNKLGPLVQPYARLGRNGDLRVAMAEVEYSEFPLMRRSALAHFIEMTFNNYEAWSMHSDRVSEALIKEMAALTESNGARFVVAFIAEKPSTVEFTRRYGIPTVDISVDWSNPEFNNQPHDNHPNARANREYADRLLAFLREGSAVSPN